MNKETQKLIWMFRQMLRVRTFEERVGEGTAWDLDYGKLLIIGLLIYHIFFQRNKLFYCNHVGAKPNFCRNEQNKKFQIR